MTQRSVGWCGQLLPAGGATTSGFAGGTTTSFAVVEPPLTVEVTTTSSPSVRSVSVACFLSLRTRVSAVVMTVTLDPPASATVIEPLPTADTVP